MIHFLILAYLVGAIPVGFIVSWLKGVENIQQRGSGNIGATNVSRVLGARYFFVVFLLDAFKAFSVIFYGQYFGLSQWIIFVGVILLLVGNKFSVFLRFTGGKGVSTSVGILFALSSKLLMVSFIPWLLSFFIFKTVGVASVIMVLTMPLLCWFLYKNVVMLILTFFIAVWILFTHQDNIRIFIQKWRR
ncbi:hypothetical protein HN446_04805 [bacterium]|jgi:acyl phosphate:glycerol-3-phosphate acyltransferase|nr:hypothetical protein [bacterium]